MIKYLLDTNICLYLMKEQPKAVVERFGEQRKGEIAVSSVTWAELCCGVNLHNSESQLAALLRALELVSFDGAAAALFGQLSQQFPQHKSSIDRMIAAHALALKVVLVTNNVADFELYSASGLRIENWLTSGLTSKSH